MALSSISEAQPVAPAGSLTAIFSPPFLSSPMSHASSMTGFCLLHSLSSVSPCSCCVQELPPPLSVSQPTPFISTHYCQGEVLNLAFKVPPVLASDVSRVWSVIPFTFTSINRFPQMWWLCFCLNCPWYMAFPAARTSWLMSASL